MFFIRPPNEAHLAELLARSQDALLNYDDQGMTHPDNVHPLPPGFEVDQHSVVLGMGADMFERCVTAMFNWQMYQNGWTFVAPQQPPQKDAVHCVTVRHFGLYSVNPVRVVYRERSQTYATFAVGALEGHVERGEERFLLELRGDGSVHFEILAVSRPASPLVQLVAPLGRLVQQRFFKSAQALMQEAALEVSATRG